MSEENQTAPQIDKGKDASSLKSPARKSGIADFFSGISLTQLTLAVMVVVFLWQWLDERRIINDMQQQLAKKISESEGSSKTDRLLLTQSQDQLSELYAKVTMLETRYAEVQNQRAVQEGLYNELSASRDEAALAEVEQMLMSAAQQLQLSANVRAALIFMQSADARLQRMKRPAAKGLSKIIGQDMDKLRVLPSVDITGINRQISRMIAAIDDLPLAYRQRAAAEPITPAVPSRDETSSQKLLREIWQEAKQLVRIENTEREEIPVLPPNQIFFLRENLKLRLLSVRIALLSRDEEVFRQELKTTQQWMTRYFDTKSAAGSEMLAGLKKLSASRINIEMPDLSPSLQAVRNYRLTREKTVR
ncbi:MAG: uroporphyrinogen-III C-methyltransferase [Gallionella sp.]